MSLNNFQSSFASIMTIVIIFVVYNDDNDNNNAVISHWMFVFLSLWKRSELGNIADRPRRSGCDGQSS